MKRLPVKSLIRFMSACKAWKSLINCSQFVSRYGVLPVNHLLLEYLKEKTFEENYVCFVDDDTFPQQKPPLLFPPLLQLLDKPDIIGTSCGLFCFYGKLDDYDNQSGMCVLWNPSIRKFVGVVVPNNHPFGYGIGFGVCPYTKDPKLVKILYTYHDEKKPAYQVMVFTLSSGEWRCLCSNKRPPRESIRFVSDKTAVIGQFIYWLASDRTNGFRRKLIMSFDMSIEEFTEVDLPDSLRESEFFIYSLREESLVLFVYNLNSTQVSDVWMLMGHGDRKAFTKLGRVANL